MQLNDTVIVVPQFPSAKARPPITVAVSCLGKQVTAVCDQIRTVDKSRLKDLIGHLSAEDLDTLDDGLQQVLSLQES